MVSSWTESEWDEAEQGWMLALGEYRAAQCPCGCGFSIQESTSPEATGPKFDVPPPRRCRARDALAMAQAGFSNPRPEATLWAVTKGG